MVTFNPTVAAMGGYALEELRHRIAALRADGARLHDFSIGDPDEPTPAFIRQALRDAVGPVSRYPTTLGQPGPRQAVVDFLARRHHVDGLDPDVHVLPSAGSKEAIFHLPFAVVDPGSRRRHVLWGDPGYPVYGRSAVLAGGVSDPVTLTPGGGWRLDLTALDTDRLDRACLVWLNYPHNPTGATVDLPWLREQVACAREHDVLVASDECYQELWFDQPAPSILQACDGPPDGVVAVLSLSKRSGMTGDRSGAIVGDARVVALQARVRPNFGTASPDFVQAAASVAWADQDHVDQRRDVFAAKPAVVMGFLDDAGIEISGSNGTCGFVPLVATTWPTPRRCWTRAWSPPRGGRPGRAAPGGCAWRWYPPWTAAVRPRRGGGPPSTTVGCPGDPMHRGGALHGIADARDAQAVCSSA